MNWIKTLVLLAVIGFALAASAQTPLLMTNVIRPENLVRAEIEFFEAQTNVLIVKGFGQGGSVNLGAGVISVRLKDSFNPDTGRRMQAVVIVYAEDERRERATIDYEEIEPLLRAIDYTRLVSYDVTGLPSFEAKYFTRDGFRVIALGSHRQTSVQDFIQFDECSRIPLNSDQIVQLRGIISQARTALDDLRPVK